MKVKRRKVPKNSFPMFAACSAAQWRGYTVNEKNYHGGVRVGGAGALSLGHKETHIWVRQRLWKDGSPKPLTSGDVLVSIKDDTFPEVDFARIRRKRFGGRKVR